MSRDSKRRNAGEKRKLTAPVALIVLSFVSSGAWLVLALPPTPIAKAFNLVTQGVWLLGFGFGVVAFAKPDRRVLWALCAVGGSVALSFLAGGSHFAVAFYDLFADMPLVQWMAFPTMFLLAAGLWADRKQIEIGLSGVVVLGTVMAVVMAVQQLTTNGSSVFGSTAYSGTALVGLIPLAVGLAASRRGVVRVLWYGCAVVIAVVLGVISGAVTGSVAVCFAILLSVVIHPAGLVPQTSVLRMLKVGSLVLAGGMVAAMIFVQVPVLSSRWVNADVFGRQKNVVSRVYLWWGAQEMAFARPVLGYGPSGYRMAAVDHLTPEALQYGADQLGNIDPTVFSPQSPHSLIWEIVTRMGVVGLLAFATLLTVWGMVLVGQLRANDGASGLRAALAAGFACALFALLVNPVVFAIGLFAPVMAGLAIGPMGAASDRLATPARTKLTPLLAVAGVAVVLLAGWLFLGEWKAYGARFENPAVAVVQYEAALRVTPGSPMTLRRLLENRLLLASDDQIGAAQAGVDASPEYIRRFGPNLSNFAAYSLAQAQRTGRKDLSWEQKLLTAAAAQMPPLPSTVAEQLHLAVLSGDEAAVEKALPDAERWGRPYPYTAAYIEAAQKLRSSLR